MKFYCKLCCEVQPKADMIFTFVSLNDWNIWANNKSWREDELEPKAKHEGGSIQISKETQMEYPYLNISDQF